MSDDAATTVAASTAPPATRAPHTSWRWWLLPVAMIALAMTIPNLAERPAPLDRNETAGGLRYGLTIGRRRAFFRDIAENDLRWRSLSAQSFPGDDWAQADHWTDLMSQHVRWMADQYKVSIVPILLAYDEGLHAGWRGPANKALRTNWPPLQTRTR